jgi:hypothetical protein
MPVWKKQKLSNNTLYLIILPRRLPTWGKELNFQMWTPDVDSGEPAHLNGQGGSRRSSSPLTNPEVIDLTGEDSDSSTSTEPHPGKIKVEPGSNTTSPKPVSMEQDVDKSQQVDGGDVAIGNPHLSEATAPKKKRPSAMVARHVTKKKSPTRTAIATGTKRKQHSDPPSPLKRTTRPRNEPEESSEEDQSSSGEMSNSDEDLEKYRSEEEEEVSDTTILDWSHNPARYIPPSLGEPTAMQGLKLLDVLLRTQSISVEQFLNGYMIEEGKKLKEIERKTKTKQEPTVCTIQGGRYEVFMYNGRNDCFRAFVKRYENELEVKNELFPDTFETSLRCVAILQAKRDSRVAERNIDNFYGFSLIISFESQPPQAPHIDIARDDGLIFLMMVNIFRRATTALNRNRRCSSVVLSQKLTGQAKKENSTDGWRRQYKEDSREPQQKIGADL